MPRFQACYGPANAKVHIADAKTSATTRLTICGQTAVVAMVRGRVLADILCGKCLQATTKILCDQIDNGSGEFDGQTTITAELIGVTEII